VSKIYTKLFDSLEIGDDFPTIIMGVLNLSPESFYKGSVVDNSKALETATIEMVENGAKMLDLGARSTAPWSKKISVDEEVNRIIPAMELVCKLIPKDIVISIDTQYSSVAQKAFEISLDYNKKILINDVSCLKTDPTLQGFIIENEVPIILMASKEIPGDLCTIEEAINELEKTINNLRKEGYNEKNIILDPGIGRWIEQKIHTYDLKIIGNLEKLRVLQKPILVAISRKSFIAGTLGRYKETPEKRYNGTLSSTAISIFNGAHIVRTHDVNEQLYEIIKLAEEIRRNK
jgi:dihydropteroate synthase